MDILDQSFEEEAKRSRLNWVGKAFYIGELLIILLLIIGLSGLYRIRNELPFHFILGYYSIGAAIFVLFGKVFSATIDKVFGLLCAGAFSLLALPFYGGDRFSSDEGLLPIATIIALVCTTSFVFFLVRAIKRDPKTSVWSYVGMLIRLGLFLIPVFLFLFFTLG